jgi:hypothetical protein
VCTRLVNLRIQDKNNQLIRGEKKGCIYVFLIKTIVSKA